MSKNLKMTILVYVGVLLMSYIFVLRMNQLKKIEGVNDNKSIVLRLK